MCGICGIINFDHDHHVEENILLKMRDVMIHRGPDDAGLYLKENVGLGHRRLSIIDLAGGRQPMSNEDGSVWISYNGEIYNYIELKERLLSSGHIFKTNSDTEVIIHAYEEFGESCLDHLRGMFAFAIWDENKRRLFAARDRLGIKPFYYTVSDGSLIFASEIKSILVNEQVERKVDEKALYYYLNVRYVPGPLTMFAGIYKLQPGHYLISNGSSISIKNYWDLKDCTAFDIDPAKNNESTFYDLIRDCVRMRLMSEVPLGVFLSGGIDSSLVVALMSEISNNQIKTFSVGYKDDYGVNEFDYAAIVAEKFNTEHHEFPISSQDFHDFLPKLVWHMDEPVSDPAAIPLFYLSQYAKDYVTVVLSGEGADEIMAGYYIYKKMLTIEKFRKLPGLVRDKIILRLLSSIFRNGKLAKYVEFAKIPLELRYKGVSRAFEKKDLENLYKEKPNLDESLDDHYRAYFEKVQNGNLLNKMLYVDTKTWLPDDLLMKADKMTMAASQELRVPFLDHKLAEFAYRLPQSEKLNGNVTKYLLRKIASNILPEAIINREKKGFPIPISQWFKGDLFDLSREVLLDSSSVSKEYFDHAYIARLIDGHKNDKFNNSEKIWNLIVFEYWYDNYFKNFSGATC